MAAKNKGGGAPTGTGTTKQTTGGGHGTKTGGTGTRAHGGTKANTPAGTTDGTGTAGGTTRHHRPGSGQTGMTVKHKRSRKAGAPGPAAQAADGNIFPLLDDAEVKPVTGAQIIARAKSVAQAAVEVGGADLDASAEENLTLVVDSRAEPVAIAVAQVLPVAPEVAQQSGETPEKLLGTLGQMQEVGRFVDLAAQADQAASHTLLVISKGQQTFIDKLVLAIHEEEAALPQGSEERAQFLTEASGFLGAAEKSGVRRQKQAAGQDRNAADLAQQVAARDREKRMTQVMLAVRSGGPVTDAELEEAWNTYQELFDSRSLSRE